MKLFIRMLYIYMVGNYLYSMFAMFHAILPILGSPEWGIVAMVIKIKY